MFTPPERRDSLTGDELRRRLASDLLGLDGGDRLPTVRSLAERHGASIGAVHQALLRLEGAGAIEVDRRHGRSAVLLGRSVGSLWAEAERDPLVVSLPLPTTPLIHGLATAIKARLSEHDVPAYLIFLRGARQRLAALRRGQCHLAVMSSLSARAIAGHTEVVLLELPARSYVQEHRVYFVHRPGADQRPERAVIDPDSADFEILTRLEFGGDEDRLVPATYMQFLRLVDEDRADAAILDSEEDAVARFPPSIHSRPLSDAVRFGIADGNTRAAFVARADQSAVRHVVRACLSTETLLSIQADVVNRDRVPEY